MVGTPSEVVDQIAEVDPRVPFSHVSFWLLAPGMNPAVTLRSLDPTAE
jgi:hypothetical protein